MQEEYETIVNAGIQLQLDCPDLALSRHMTFKNDSDDDFIKIAAHNMEILNESLKNIPSNKLRFMYVGEIMKVLILTIYRLKKFLKS